MFFGGDLCKSVILTIGFFLFVAKAQDEYPYPIVDNLLYEGIRNTLQCYDCNSEYDPRCGDPFNPYTIGVINCTDRNTPEHLIDPFDPDIKLKPTLCRKIVQKVQGRTRVIRGCGYIKNSHDDRECFRRTGTKDVEVVHCSCTKSLCNAGNSVLHSATILNVFSSSILLVLMMISRHSSF